MRREANKAAHWCAQEGLKSASDVNQFDVIVEAREKIQLKHTT